ncbi:F-box domain [Dillenia turbinata]|uniref:F-box domain n=1 Tax=Dillenia turbinata TaxID=194707 RepID=A0AAN8UE86_9MAGN
MRRPKIRNQDRINSILPDESILEIFCHIEAKSSRDACALVCKRWRHLELLILVTIRLGASAFPDALAKLLARQFVNVRNIFIDERLPIWLPIQVCKMFLRIFK